MDIATIGFSLAVMLFCFVCLFVIYKFFEILGKTAKYDMDKQGEKYYHEREIHGCDNCINEGCRFRK